MSSLGLWLMLINTDYFKGFEQINNSSESNFLVIAFSVLYGFCIFYHKNLSGKSVL